MLTERTRSRFWELVRFGLVGVANTAVYYGAYRLFLLGMAYLAAHLVAWAVSVVFSFFMNCRFTYRVKPTWRRFVAFPASVAVNFGFTTFGTVLLVEAVGVSERIAPIICGVLAIPITFTVTRFVLTNAAVVGAPDSAVEAPGRSGEVEAAPDDSACGRGD